MSVMLGDMVKQHHLLMLNSDEKRFCSIYSHWIFVLPVGDAKELSHAFLLEYLDHIAEDRYYQQFVEPELRLETDVAFQYPGHHWCSCSDVCTVFCIARVAPRYFNMANLIKYAFRFLKLFRVLTIQRYWLDYFVVKKIINKSCYYYFSQLMMLAADKKFNFRSPFMT